MLLKSMVSMSNPTFAVYRCALASAFALGLVAVASLAHAQEDDDELTFEQQIIRSLLGGGSSRPDIDYRERSPLVIPPARDLPPPAAGATVQRNPAWPQDPDQKQTGSRRTDGPRSAHAAAERGASVLSPDELRRGRAAASRDRRPVPTPNDNEMGRPLRPDEIPGTRSLFSLISPSPANEKFTGEPTRRKMTDPPAGYRTPAPTQPYAAPAAGPAKLPSFFDRGTEMR
ncbi:MAG TPA: hypothetical protein VHG27_06575 [Xanthobacteraceae bacterium]|nr:hypothetical protein [Xanthobacteraceae bacterium]